MTNSLNEILNIKTLPLEAFWSSTALLQSQNHSDLFYLIVGPFKQVQFNQHEIDQYLSELNNIEHQYFDYQKSTVPLLYIPEFWDFIKTDIEKNSYLVGSYFFTVSRAELIDYLKTLLESEMKSKSQFQLQSSEFILQEPFIQLKWKSVSEDNFVQQFNWSQKQFSAKNLIKTVPIISQEAEGDFKPIHFIQCLLKLLGEKHFGWIYSFWYENQGFLGISPELILDWQGKETKLKTSALAGTLKKTTTSAFEIINDKKILHEHQIVVDDIQNILNTTLPNRNISKQKTEVLSLKFLEHLKTDFSCFDVDRNQALELLSSMHPTAALGIYPRNFDKAKEFSSFKIQKERKNFAAPFAMITNSSIQCVAAIRNLYFQKNKIIIYSGCGVTSESQLQSELKELESKRMSVVKMMGLVND